MASVERNSPRPGAVVRQPRHGHGQRCTRRQRRSLREDVSLPFELALLHVRKLRRGQRDVAGLLHQHGESGNGQRKRLLERHIAARDGHPKCDLHFGLPGRKRTRDGHVIAERDRLRRAAQAPWR